MREDHADTQDPRETTPEDYEAPTVTDLGSFEDLTRFNPSGPVVDSEGFSAG